MKLDPDAALDYMEFVIQRHKIYERRQAGEPPPWTTDRILASRKFTNVFRVLDYGSQYVVRELLPGASWLDTVFRVALYRKTNRPEPWVAFTAEFGRVPSFEDVSLLREFWREWIGDGRAFVSMAYRHGYVPPGQNLMDMALDSMPAIPELARRLEQQPTLTGRLGVLRDLPRAGDFMRMQIATDLGYSPLVRGDENETVLAGPGSESGLSLLYPGSFKVRNGGNSSVPMLVLEALRTVTGWWDDHPDCPQLAGRRPSLMDVQNTFCEFFKYNRARSRPPVGKPYRPAHPGPQPPPVIPSHWRSDG